MASNRINIRLSEDLHRRLKAQCALAGISIQEFVEKLIEENVDDEHIRKSINKD